MSSLESMAQGIGRMSRLCKARVFVFSLLVGLLVWAMLGMHPFTVKTLVVQQNVFPAVFSYRSCERPKLDPSNPLLVRHIKDVGDLECKTEPDWVYLANGYLHMSPGITKKYGSITCTVNFLTRKTDFKNSLGPDVTFTSDAVKLKLVADFFHVKCVAGDKIWTDVMAGIHRNETAAKRAKERTMPPDATRLNVLMFGLDSMSRLHYVRKMRKTYSYMKNELNAVVLEGYNIVGDGTPQALIPILTAFTEQELPETRKRMEGANHVNVYPFIWKNFSANGYVTAFAEDTPSTGIFTYRLTGFGEQPTDHYMRAFYVEAEGHFKKHPRLCLGSLPRHKVMLDWLRQFYDVYSDVPKFAFGFHGELSHDDYNTAQYADRDIYNFLRGLSASGILNNTMLILMSDHGHRFASIRETQQGKQEERLPFFSIAMPPSFASKYPQLYKNLLANSEKLATPFDIYSTLATVLDPHVPIFGNAWDRSISLFSNVPKERTCSDASVEPHWCTCLLWEKVQLDDKAALQAAQSVIDFINEYTQSHKEACARLTLDKLTRAERFLPNSALLKYKQNMDKDGFVADLTDKMEATEVLYSVQFHVFPSGGIYEASVKHNRGTSSSFKVRESEISRINMYGSQPHCVQDRFPNLRKYCYCKVQPS